MAGNNGPNGNAETDVSDEQLSALLVSAEQVQASAKEVKLEFVAYLAEMTVMEIRQEIERRAQSAK